MSDLQIKCPKCQRRYLASPIQLSLSRGQVCCVACHFNFNAYPHLHLKPVEHKIPPHEVELYNNYNDPTQDIADHPELRIFTRTIATSNIDFKAYLNNTPSFTFNPIGQPISTPLPQPKIPTESNRFRTLLLVIFILVFIFIILCQFFIHHRALHQHAHLFHLGTHHQQTSDLAATIIKMDDNPKHQPLLTVQIRNTGSRPYHLPFLNIEVNNYKTLTFTPKQYLTSSMTKQPTLAAKQVLNVTVQLPISFNNIHALEVYLSSTPNE
ncbi:hypothetical protein [Acinetobacter sp. MD2]|uniref:hypothetical protein n=1 Tax=Acinetobacter sp. MD2 TaxID=2600066 RepID=UPI002D1EAD6B|nr:hypothetical protein [Acinetobacter sp. MD2]MEB3766291.1 hypothetical protein [Acinetobacter sp. MD2]